MKTLGLLLGIFAFGLITTYSTSVNAAPTVTSVSPTSGPIAGTTRVGVEGANFVNGATVSFGGTAGTNVSFGNSTFLLVTAPAHAAGTVDVTVTNPDAQSGTLANAYTYVDAAPTTTTTSSTSTTAPTTSTTITSSSSTTTTAPPTSTTSTTTTAPATTSTTSTTTTTIPEPFVYVEPFGTCDDNFPCYSTVQEGIDFAISGDTVMIGQGTYDEDISIDTSKNLTLQGGWDSGFTTQSSTSTVNSMTISDGTVTVDNLMIQ